jgi:hypothetical protein
VRAADKSRLEDLLLDLLERVEGPEVTSRVLLTRLEGRQFKQVCRECESDSESDKAERERLLGGGGGGGGGAGGGGGGDGAGGGGPSASAPRTKLLDETRASLHHTTRRKERRKEGRKEGRKEVSETTNIQHEQQRQYIHPTIVHDR